MSAIKFADDGSHPSAIEASRAQLVPVGLRVERIFLESLNVEVTVLGISQAHAATAEAAERYILKARPDGVMVKLDMNQYESKLSAAAHGKGRRLKALAVARPSPH